MPNESGKESGLALLFNRDAIVLAVLTSLSYYFVYSFQESFLGHFGIGRIFVEVTLEKILRTFAAVIAVLTLVYLLSLGIPIRIIRPLLGICLIWSVTIICGIYGGFFFVLFGFHWVTLASLLVFLFFLIGDSITTFKMLKSSNSFLYEVEVKLEPEKNVGDQLLGWSFSNKIIDQFGSLPWFIIIVALSGGGLFGDIAAAWQRDYSVLLIENTRFAVIQSYGDGLLLSAFEASEEQSNEYNLLGPTMFMSLSETSGVEFGQIENAALINEAAENSSRVSFEELISSFQKLID